MLKKIKVKNGVGIIPEGTIELMYHTFEDASKLVSVVIPNTVRCIGFGAFEGCSSLTSISIPSSVNTIQGRAFEGCSSLTSISIPSSVKTIQQGAFKGCSSLATIVVEEGNRHYDSRNNCNAIIETKSNTLVVGCKNTIIHDSITHIGASAFDGCTSLASITIPNGVIDIGSSAFDGCTSLASVSIPSSVTRIGSHVFYNTQIYNDESNWDCGLLYVDSCLVDSRQGDSVKKVSIKDNTRIIAIDSLGCIKKNLTSITLSNGLLAIPEGTFSECVKLTSVTLPNSLQSIGAQTFCGCTKLASITIPHGVQSIGNGAFDDCKKLTTITIPDSVTSIGERAFVNCKALTTVILSEGLLSIGKIAFAFCESLNEIVIPHSVNSLGESAFSYCHSLKSVVLSKKLKTIEKDTFYECSALESIVIPNSVTTIKFRAFVLCTSLTSVTLSNKLRTIEQFAFGACRALKTIAIPDSIRKLEDSVFLECTELESIIVSSNAKKINPEVFDDCSKVKILTQDNNTNEVDTTNKASSQPTTPNKKTNGVEVSVKGTNYTYTVLYGGGGITETVALYCDQIDDVEIYVKGKKISKKSVLKHINDNMGTAQDIAVDTTQVDDVIAAIRLTQLLGQTKSCIVEFDGEFDPMKLQLNIGFCKFNLEDEEFSDDEPLLLSISYDGVEYPLNHDKFKQGYESSEIIWGEDPDDDEDWEDED